MSGEGTVSAGGVSIALFRGINVGGHNKLPMKELVRELEGLGLSDVRTYIQSGNAVFRGSAKKPADLHEQIGAAELAISAGSRSRIGRQGVGDPGIGPQIQLRVSLENHARDPGQTHNVADQHPERVLELRALRKQLTASERTAPRH